MKIPLKRVVSILLTLIVGIILFYKVDLNKIWAAFSGFQWKYIVIIAPLYFLTYVIKSFRWRIILNNSTCKISDLIGIIYIGYIVNVFIPARAGDFYRGYLLNKTQDVKFLKGMGTIVFERILDGIILFLMLLAVVATVYANDWTIRLSVMVGAIFFLSLYVVYLIGSEKENRVTSFFKSKFNFAGNKFAKYMEAFKEGIQIVNRPKAFFTSAFLTFLTWFTEALVMFFIFKSFNIALGIIPSIFVLCVVIFSSLIPAGSLFVGTFQCGYILALSLFHISRENALAISIVSQMITLVIISLASIYYFYKYQDEILAINAEKRN